MPTAQELIDNWGRKKYPDAPAGNFRLETETRSEEYCDICYDEYAVVAVYVNNTTVDELRSVTINDMLLEILNSQ